jgi:prepilin-type N-terminal cleavage/methylation domain-containing protein
MMFRTFQFAADRRPHPAGAFRPMTAVRRAFTIMELMVAIAILVIIILSVAVIFSGASKSVSSSTALMETLSNVRAIQQQVDRLVGGIDKNGFLIIRSQMLYAGDPATVLPPNADTSPRFDQVSFLSYGTFPNRTGSDTVQPFVDGTSSNVAHVWIGHLVLEQNRASAAQLTNASFALANQAAPLGIDAWPTGVLPGATPTQIENQCTLGIHTTLLMPGVLDATNQLTVTDANVPAANKRVVKAFRSIIHDPADTIASVDGKAAHITSSRVAVAATTPPQLISDLVAQGIDSNRICYRFKALESIYDTDAASNQFVNGYFRQHPIALRGVSSFKVDWQDGSTGDWHWFNKPSGLPGVDVQYKPTPDPVTGNSYIASFTPNNRLSWPVALRFTYHIVDPNNRLQGGRDFTQVVRLPR